MELGWRVDYAERIAAEHATFGDQEDLHGDLPESAHFWSERFMLPKLNALGVTSVEQLIVDEIGRRAVGSPGDVVVLSLGSGNGDLELGWLRSLADRGVTNVRMRLLEFNPRMQERAAQAADRLGLSDRVELVVADFNTWRADARHDVVVAFEALHHVVDLEHLYGQIRDSLTVDGVVVVHDMIGRNGHRRWPEALEVIERIWATLPPELRRNSITGEVDDHYDDLDCAVDGFEGIRAQDVLPVLLDHLHPSLFLACGNVIDPFVERIYGHNFDMESAAHRDLIERIGTLDDALIDLGVVTPTRLTALFHREPHRLRVHGMRTPERCIRRTSVIDPAGRVSFDPHVADRSRIVQGAGVAVGRTNGIFDDQWVGRSAEIVVFPTADVGRLELTTYLPDWMPRTGNLTIEVDGESVGTVEPKYGLCTNNVPVDLPARRVRRLALLADWSVNQDSAGLGQDRRTLSYVLTCVAFREK